MNGIESLHGERSLALIESDLLKAEAKFAEADARLKEAQRDRVAALDTINKHQTEFDEAVAELRQRSTPGSKWKHAKIDFEQTVIAQDEDMPEDARTRSASLDPDASKPGRIKTLRRSIDDSPLLKINI